MPSHPIPLTFLLILSPPLGLDTPHNLFLSGLQTKNFMYLSHVRYMLRQSHAPNFVILVVFSISKHYDAPYYIIFTEPPVTSCSLSPNNHLSPLFSHVFALWRRTVSDNALTSSVTKLHPHIIILSFPYNIYFISTFLVQVCVLNSLSNDTTY